MLAVVVADNDPAAIAASIARLGWRLAIILLFPFVLVSLFDTLGWRFAFPIDRARFGTLVMARLAGEAFNVVTPTATLGGEAVKAWLLRGRVPTDEAVSSVIVAKTTITIGQGLLPDNDVAAQNLLRRRVVERHAAWQVKPERDQLGARPADIADVLPRRGAHRLAVFGRFAGHLEVVA